MDYSVWIDAEGKYCDISSMPTYRIKSCLKDIESAIILYIPRDGTSPLRSDDPSDGGIYLQNWTIDHAENYREAFLSELSRRNEFLK